MSNKYKNKYRIPSARLQNWDYGNNGAYFITICTKNRKHFFGEIVDTVSEPEMQLNGIGKLAEQFWVEIPIHFPFIELGNFVVMPNHVHGILIIDKPNNEPGNGNANVDFANVVSVETRHCLVSTNANDTSGANGANKKTIGQMRFQNQGENTISSIVGSYKSVVTKNAHLIDSDFAWQSRFHDHIIRDAESFERIQNYIENNPLNWKGDKFYL